MSTVAFVKSSPSRRACDYLANKYGDCLTKLKILTEIWCESVVEVEVWAFRTFAICDKLHLGLIFLNSDAVILRITVISHQLSEIITLISRIAAL